MTEEEMLEGLRSENGDRKNSRALDYMYLNFGPKVLGMVIKNSGSEEEGYDVLQNTQLQVWQKVRTGNYQHEGKFKSYFFGVAYKLWLHELRKKKTNATISLDGLDYPIQVVDESEQDTFQAIIKDQRLEVMHRALTEIGESCGRFLRRFHLDKIPTKQIAEEENTSDGYVRKRLHTCRETLKTLVHKFSQS